MNHLTTICLTILGVVAAVCATLLALDGKDAAAAWAVVTGAVGGITGYTVGRALAERTP